ncbi:hypothetical protein PV703_14365 [Streptomyces sp. ME01-24h]|nr:hypothetical protein [Streptomyces sp. ME01-24h]
MCRTAAALLHVAFVDVALLDVALLDVALLDVAFVAARDGCPSIEAVDRDKRSIQRVHAALRRLRRGRVGGHSRG